MISHIHSRKPRSRRFHSWYTEWLIALALILTAVPALAWPERTVRIVTPTGAGGGSDAVARTLVDRLAKRWKQPVVVENRPGADGFLAVGEMINARDNHTILFSWGSIVTVNPHIHEKLPYDPIRDVLPISFVVNDYIAVAATPTLPANSLTDLINLAKSKPSELNYSAGPGSPYLAFLEWQKGSGIALTFVPYRNPIASVGDLIEGRIHVAVMPLSLFLGQALAGKVKILAVASPQRAPGAPEIPTTAEAGAPKFSIKGGLGFFAPKEMSVELRERIAGEVQEILNEPQIRARIANLGYNPRGTNPSEYAAILAEESAKWGEVARAYGARP